MIFLGITLERIDRVKLSLDSMHFLIFDSVNLNLLEYELNGKFSRIVLKAEERLGNVLDFEFSGEHIITSEVATNKQTMYQVRLKSTPPSLTQIKDAMGYQDLKKRLLSKTHVFKLKTFKYMDCDCHKSMNKRPNLQELAKFGADSKHEMSNINNRIVRSVSLIDNDDFETNFANSMNFD